MKMNLNYCNLYPVAFLVFLWGLFYSWFPRGNECGGTARFARPSSALNLWQQVVLFPCCPPRCGFDGLEETFETFCT